MLIDLRLCVAKSKKDGKWWFLRDMGPEYEPQFQTLAGPFETSEAAQSAWDAYNVSQNAWDKIRQRDSQPVEAHAIDAALDALAETKS